MMGFILTKKQADKVEQVIKNNFAKQGLPFFWSPGFYLIDSGPDAGKYFMPMSDDITSVTLYKAMKFTDFADNLKEIIELRKTVVEKDFDISNLKAVKIETT